MGSTAMLMCLYTMDGTIPFKLLCIVCKLNVFVFAAIRISSSVDNDDHMIRVTAL